MLLLPLLLLLWQVTGRQEGQPVCERKHPVSLQLSPKANRVSCCKVTIKLLKRNEKQNGYACTSYVCQCESTGRYCRTFC